MNRSLLLAFLLCGVCACEGVAKARGEAQGPPPAAPLDPTAFASLREDMLAGYSHATFDGAPVTDLRETLPSATR